MSKLLTINTSFHTGGAGKVARGIAQAAAAEGWEVLAAHSSRFDAQLPSGVEGYRIGSRFSEYLHAFFSRATGMDGLGSIEATQDLIEKIRKFRPDLIHLHNLHGYYLNFRLLFDYLRRCGVPVVWTLHDLWPLTGRCAFPQAADCERFHEGCGGCTSRGNYPRAWLDRSRACLKWKQESLAEVPDLHLVSMSRWMSHLLSASSLNGYPLHIIPNGVDINLFSPDKTVPETPKSILCVASKWTEGKGYDDIITMAKLLPDGYKITVAGVSSTQKRALSPLGIVAIEKTESPTRLADLYRRASVFVSLSRADNFPTVVLESLACGVPVVAYDTGACREIISDGCGYIVERGNIEGAIEKIKKICVEGKSRYTAACRNRAVALYDTDTNHRAYLELFNQLV